MISNIHSSNFHKYREFSLALDKGKSFFLWRVVDRRRVVMVYLETEKKELPTCAFKESPGVQAKMGEITCKIPPHSPQSYSCEKEGGIVPAKDMKSFTEHFVSKA